MQRVCTKIVSQTNEVSYLFQTRVNANTVMVWNGAADRVAGGRSANDPLGTGRQPNAAIAWQCDPGDYSEDHMIRATKTITPMSRVSTEQQVANAEVLWRYGPNFDFV